jgi:hypothetical protein
MYFGEPPLEINIDGIFYDWSHSPTTEIFSDMDLPILQKKMMNIDINDVGIDIDQNHNTLSFYLSTMGFLLEGESIPPIFFTEVLSSQKPSSVGNSSNDKLIQTSQDSESIQELPDELLGTDKISIFIDSDQKYDTGYNPSWLTIGAEYLIEISGRDRQISQNDLKFYTGSQSNIWSWETIAEIPVDMNSAQMETQLNWDKLRLMPFSDVDVVYYVSDWSGENTDFVTIDSAMDITGNEDNFPTISSRAGYFVNATTDMGNTIKFPNQRKIVRDYNGYWYVFWIDNDQILRGMRSTDTSGTIWNTNPVLLAGNAGSVIKDANNKTRDPSVDIYLNSVISQNEIHLVWGMEYNNKIALLYSKCADITSDANFRNTNSWQKADGSTGFDIIDDHIDNGTLIKNNYGKASIAVDTSKRPHIVWQYEYDNNVYYINYTRYDSTNGWHNGIGGPIRISSNPIDNHRTPAIDVGFNGTIHVAYNYYSGFAQIKYRQCWDITNSMNINYWGDAGRNSGGEDTPISRASNHINEPSLVCDTQRRVWIVSYESSTWDIWFSMEDFGDASYWPGPYRIASSGDNRYPTIGYDDSNKVYCFWQHKEGLATFNISYAYNASSGWSVPVEVASGKEFIYPQIPKNLTPSNDIIGCVYKNETDDGLMFESIPELPAVFQFIVLILFVQILILSCVKKIQFKQNNQKME